MVTNQPELRLVASESASEIGQAFQPWRILLAGCGRPVRDAMHSALKDFTFAQRSTHLQWLQRLEDAQPFSEPSAPALVFLAIHSSRSKKELQWVEQMRDRFCNPAIQIVLITAHPSLSDIATTLDYEVNSYLTEQELTPRQILISVTTGLRAYQTLARQIQATTELKQAEQALQRSRRRYKTLVSKVPGAVYRSLCSADWQLEFISDAIADLTGYPAADYLAPEGRQLTDAIASDDREQVAQAFEAAMAAQRQFSLEYRMVHADGTVHWVLEIGDFSHEGELHWQDGVLFDVTEQHEADVAMAKARERAEVANRAKSEFLASMSHELRTPLNAILGFSQLMTRDTTLSREQQKNLSIINRSGEHLLELINDVLEMSKIEAGRTTFNENSFDLHRLLHTLEEMLGLRVKSKGLQLVFERSPQVPQYVSTDEGKLRQVLINLLGNAIKFTEKGVITLRIQSQAQAPCDIADAQTTSLVFEVEDTGPGIAVDEVDQLFEAFGQTETGRKSQQGTGLGLPISRKFVQLMGGDITVSRAALGGAIFRFDIRAEVVQRSRAEVALSTRSVIGLAPDQPCYRILIVEDRVENQLLLEKLLRPMAFDLRIVVNGEEAVQQWQEWSPHLIWMDIQMPVMDGYEATRQIRALERQAEGQETTKILALTASAMDADRDAVLAAGCDDFVRKPFQEAFLFDKMAEHLGLTYRYAEDESRTSKVGATEAMTGAVTFSPDVELKPEVLKNMPLDWVEQLYTAALGGDDAQVVKLLEQMPEEKGAVRDRLQLLVDDFRLDVIADLAYPPQMSP